MERWSKKDDVDIARERKRRVASRREYTMWKREETQAKRKRPE